MMTAPELVCPRCSNDRADLLELVAKDRCGWAVWFCRVCGKLFAIDVSPRFQP